MFTCKILECWTSSPQCVCVYVCTSKGASETLITSVANWLLDAPPAAAEAQEMVSDLVLAHQSCTN